MKPEIKFSVFVDKELIKYVADDPDMLPMFLAAMKAVGVLQTYCYELRINSRMKNPPFSIRLRMDQEYLGVLFIDPFSSSGRALRMAMEQASRVRCIVLKLCDGDIGLKVSFFKPGDRDDILALDLHWRSFAGDPVGGLRSIAISNELVNLSLAGESF